MPDPAPLSGRCPVILKTDMTHLANKGEDRGRILAGLFDAVCENVLVLLKPGLSPGRVLLAGEAGGFMSPTSGEGISYALNSGRLAGQAIADGTGANSLARYRSAIDPIARNVARKLKWLPFMESRAGKYLAGFVPAPVVSRITKGL